MRLHVGTPERFKPSRDRIIRSRAVPCPICGAAVNENCRKVDGTPGSNTHKRRRRLAFEAGH